MTNTKHISIPFAPGSFPMAELIENRVWAQIPPAAKAVLAVIWNYHRRFPESCHPSRQTIAAEAGVHASTVSRSLDVLEAMGLVEVVPQLGPRPNTYKVKWTNIAIEARPEPTRKSPYAKRASNWDVDLGQDEDGNDVTRYTRKNVAVHLMPDGCRVRSAKEMLLHSFLVAWRVPHWTDVPYEALKIKLKNPATGGIDTVSTVDFVVAPFYLFELRGLPHHDAAVKKYKEKLRRKLAAVSQSDWDGYVLHPEQRPGGHLLKLILKAWATSTVEDAKALRELMRAAGKYEASHEPSRWLDEMIADAEGRMSGLKPQRKPRGLSVMVRGNHGFSHEQRTKPDLVLMEIAGEEHTQRRIDEAGRQLDDDYVPPTPHSARPPATQPVPNPIPAAPTDPSVRRPGESEDDYLDRLLDE